jgi:predicted transcriptional regulator
MRVQEIEFNKGEDMRRSRHSIISKILDRCVEGANKSRIVYQANLKFGTVNPYIDLLENFKQIHRELSEL